MAEPRFVRSRDSRTGTVYVYQVIENYWDKEKQQARNKRILVGRIDPSTGNVVPTGPRGRPRRKQSEKPSMDDGTDYKALYEKTCEDLSRLEVQHNNMKVLMESLVRSHENTVAQIRELQTKVNKEYEVIQRLQRNLLDSSVPDPGES